MQEVFFLEKGILSKGFFAPAVGIEEEVI